MQLNVLRLTILVLNLYREITWSTEVSNSLLTSHRFAWFCQVHQPCPAEAAWEVGKPHPLACMIKKLIMDLANFWKYVLHASCLFLYGIFAAERCKKKKLLPWGLLVCTLLDFSRSVRWVWHLQIQHHAQNYCSVLKRQDWNDLVWF